MPPQELPLAPSLPTLDKRRAEVTSRGQEMRQSSPGKLPPRASLPAGLCVCKPVLCVTPSCSSTEERGCSVHCLTGFECPRVNCTSVSARTAVPSCSSRGRPTPARRGAHSHEEACGTSAQHADGNQGAYGAAAGISPRTYLRVSFCISSHRRFICGPGLAGLGVCGP